MLSNSNLHKPKDKNGCYSLLEGQLEPSAVIRRETQRGEEVGINQMY